MIAYIIDVIIVGLVSLIALFIVMPFFLIDFISHGFRAEFWAPWSAFSGITSIISLLYFSFMESSWGSTIGKSALGLKVTTEKGERLTLDKAFLRNISKLHLALLLLDILIGLGTRGDPNQKFSDRYIGTLVVRTAT
ncbi:MAG: RDD family protein [Thermoproteota archaeon]